MRWLSLRVVTKRNRFIIVLLIMSLFLVACGSGNSQTPTQTPLVIIVTGDTPNADTVDGNSNSNSDATSESDLLPTPHLCESEIVEQAFENGRMFWVGNSINQRCQIEQSFEPGTGEIWVAIFDESGRSGEWLIFEDDWVEGVDPESDPDMEPPDEGLLQPVRGFGKVWREKLSAVQRETLGWAITIEIKFVTDYRYEAGGFIDGDGEYVPRPGLNVIISLGGEQFFFDEPSQTFDYVPAN